MLLCVTPPPPPLRIATPPALGQLPRGGGPDGSLPSCHFKKLGSIISSSICLGLPPASPKPSATPKFPSPCVRASSVQERGLARGSRGRLDGQQVALGRGALGTAVVGWMNNVAPTPSSLPIRVVPSHWDGLPGHVCTQGL